MPIEIHTPSCLNPVPRSFPQWSATTPQDFVSVNPLNNYVKQSKYFNFKLRSQGNAYIIFVLFPRSYYHICIGDDLQNNTCSTYNPQNGKKSIIQTPNILSANDFKGFWIKWSTNSVCVGRENETEPFILWNDQIDLNLNNLRIGFCTIETIGTWIIDDAAFRQMKLSEPPEEQHTGCWVEATGGKVPPGAISIGPDTDEEQYIARGYYRNQLIPGKLHPSHGCCYITFEGREYACHDYEVLCSLRGEWVLTRNGDALHPNAVKSICKRSGETFHIGRAYIDGTTVLGKVYPSSRLCYVGSNGNEVLAVDYELFITNSRV